MFYEVELEVGVSLLGFFHGGISEVIEVHIFHASIDAVRKPTIDESGSCLERISFLAREGDEMDTLGCRIVMDRESRDGRISLVANIASNALFIYPGYGAIVPDIVGFEEVADLRFLEGIGKSLSVHELDSDFGWIVGEVFFACTLGSLIPFFVVLMVVYLDVAGSREVCFDRKLPPSLGDIGTAKGNPYDESADESVGLEDFFCRLYIDPLELRELHIFPENPLHPRKSCTFIQR